MSGDQNAGRNQNIKRYNSSFKMVELFEYLGNTPNGSKFFQEEIKGRMKSGNAYYDSAQNLLSSGTPYKNIKIKIYIYKYSCLFFCMGLKLGHSY
jgi:hypothetical protein